MILRRLLVLATGSLVIALPALSQPASKSTPGKPSVDVQEMHGSGAGEAVGGGFEHLQGKYALTPDQHKKLQELATQLFGHIQTQMPILEAKRIAVLQALTEAKIEPDKLQSLQTALNTATNGLANDVLQNQIKQMQVLTPEQRAQMKPTPGDNNPTVDSGK